MAQRQQSTHQYLAGIHPVAGIAVHHTHDSHVDQVDGKAHPGQGHPGWPGEDAVYRAAGSFDASQDHPGDGQGPGKPVEAAIDGPLSQRSVGLKVFLVRHQPIDHKTAHQKGYSPYPGQGHGIEGKFLLVFHLVKKVAESKSHEIWLEPLGDN